MLDVQTIPLLTLPSVPFAARPRLPRHAVLFIGRSVNLAARWSRHHQTANLMHHGATRIAWLVIDDAAFRDEVEAACIAYFEPVCNTMSCIVTNRYAAVRNRLARVLAACKVTGSPVHLSRLLLRSRYAKDALLTPDEVCEIIGMSRSSLEPLIVTGEIQSIKIGKLRRIPRAALDVWLQERLEASAQPRAVTDTAAPQKPPRQRKRQPVAAG